MEFRQAGVASPSATQNRTRGRCERWCSHLELGIPVACWAVALQGAGSAAHSELGPSTSRPGKGTAPKKQGRMCAGSGRHNGAEIRAVFSSELGLAGENNTLGLAF